MERMTSNPTVHATPGPSDTVRPLVFGWRTRLWARLRASTLDRELAAGAPVGWSRHTATRARLITDPGQCRVLAESWANLLLRSKCPPAGRTLGVPLCRTRILAAEHHIRLLVAALEDARPEGARGVAMATTLIRDGSGPIYNPRSPDDLASLVQEATGYILAAGELEPA
jgi:hypothetical protein